LDRRAYRPIPDEWAGMSGLHDANLIIVAAFWSLLVEACLRAA